MLSDIEIVIGSASGALGGFLEMTHNRGLVLFHYWRWDFSGWVHVVEHYPRMTATCKDAGY
jgi:hypothetical protein